MLSFQRKFRNKWPNVIFEKFRNRLLRFNHVFFSDKIEN